MDEQALRARVAARVGSGEYPDTLDEDLERHYEEILGGRRGSREASALDALLARVDDASEFKADRIPYVSRVPMGARLHRTVGQVVRRQTAGVLGQVDAYALALRDLLVAIIDQLADEDAVRESTALLNARIDAALDLLSRRPTAEGGRLDVAADLTWAPEPALSELLNGSRDEALQTLAPIADQLAAHRPVLVLGCGRGEMLELLRDRSTPASGIDMHPDLVAICRARNLEAQGGVPASALHAQAEGLGSIFVDGVMRRLPARDRADLLLLAAGKLSADGLLVIRDLQPSSPQAADDPLAVAPASPRLLELQCHEAGFNQVAVGHAGAHFTLSATR